MLRIARLLQSNIPLIIGYSQNAIEGWPRAIRDSPIAKPPHCRKRHAQCRLLIPPHKQEAMIAAAQSSYPLLPRPHPNHCCLGIGLGLDPVEPHRQLDGAF